MASKLMSKRVREALEEPGTDIARSVRKSRCGRHVPAAFCNRIPSMMVSFAARAAKAMNSLMVAPLRAFLHQVMATPFAIATPKQMFAMPLKAESRTLGPIFWAQCFCFLPSETRRTMSELFAQRMMVNKAMAPFQGNLALRPVLH
ncbi:hypothetical protein KCV06_g686, partial [Aureobasidium melanogenum]